MPDTGGNPVQLTLGLSADGNRAMFRIAGGTPISDTGSLFAMFFSERTASSWQVKQVTPPREELVGGDWEQTAASTDLSTIVSANTDYTVGAAAIWRLKPNGQPLKLFQVSPGQEYKVDHGPLCRRLPRGGGDERPDRPRPPGGEHRKPL